jgi:hypothetical protein
MVNRLARAIALQQNFRDHTGIDFVQVRDSGDQRQLRIFFLTDATQLTFPLNTSTPPLTPANIVIHNVSDANRPDIPVVTVGNVVFDANLERAILDITVAQPGEFADYRLRIDDPRANPDPLQEPYSRIDPFFNDVRFSFKAGCDDGQECLDPAPVCPVDEQPDFPVDYLARDFVSLRNALLDFAAQRYPRWVSPIEADVGVMLAEVMAALGDEFAYVQDRFGREAYLETATERRSLRKKARLLDFEIHDGRSPSTLVELTVSGAGDTLSVPRGSRAWATTEGGTPIAFEVGLGLRDGGEPFAVHQSWNAGDAVPPGSLTPYAFDESQICLLVGATEMFVLGTVARPEALFDEATKTGRVLLLRTDPADPALPPRRHFVRLVERPVALFDPLTDLTVTRLRWGAEDALPFQIDQSLVQLSFNVVPVTAGLTQCARFVCGDQRDADDTRPPVLVTAFDCGQAEAKPAPGLAVEREGPLPIRVAPALAADVTPDAGPPERDERPTIFLVGLPDTDTGGLGVLGLNLRESVPEVLVTELFIAPGGGETTGIAWDWQRSLLSSDANSPVFTLEDGIWRRIISFTRNGVVHVHQDYATGAGYSLRFGDGVFGRTPPRGQAFEVRYRLGPGAKGNVPEGAINAFTVPDHPDRDMPGFVMKVRNPVEVRDGVDPESAQEVKQIVPEAFKADRLFAVTPDDYGQQAEKLDFVQRAQGTPRWTGSWLSMFVAADPFGSFDLTAAEREDLGAWMNCVRQTGREVIVSDPRPLIIDLLITICVEPFAYASQVMALVRELLVGAGGGRNTRPFFSPDNFTFGMPLRRSALEAAILRVPGVRFVRSILVRERGLQGFRLLDDLLLEVEPNQVLRLDDDPLHPEAGTLTLQAEGGA